MPETFTPPPIDMTVIALPTLLIVWAMALLVIDLFVPRPRLIGMLALAGVIITGIAGVFLWGIDGQRSFNDMVIQDRFGLYVNWILLLATAITILISLDYLPRLGIESSEYYPLLLLATSGMMFLAQADDLIIIFLGIELLSITLYVLTGFAYPRLASGEAGMKYLLLGAFAAGFLVYGIALVYGATGQTALPRIASEIARQAGSPNLLLVVGMGLLIVALGFKVAAVPFHTWTPDVYQGAPTSVTAYMSVATKAAAFAALFRLLVEAFPALIDQWQAVLAAFAVLTMVVGNVVAVVQMDLKRLLAYSSIAHAGYILLGVIAGDARGATAILLYLLVYTLANIGAFAVIAALETRSQQQLELQHLSGLSSRHPLLAMAMAIFMLSLTGVPPTAGFIGKFAVFQAAWQSGYAWLALVGVIASAISAFFYLRIIVLMYMREPVAEERPLLQGPLAAGLTVTAVSTLVLILFIAPLLSVAENSLSLLAGR